MAKPPSFDLSSMISEFEISRQKKAVLPVARPSCDSRRRGIRRMQKLAASANSVKWAG
jgi:hypothetical protein